jgi:hypothetical protein
MKQLTAEGLKKLFENLAYRIDTFQLVGIRSMADAPDKFDDLIGVFQYIDGKPTVNWFTGTTNPGVHWLKNFMNPKGTAVLMPGVHENCWVLGKHQGKYEALVQYAPVTVFRDKNKNNKSEIRPDKGPVKGEKAVLDRGLFGINIHRANEKTISMIIDRWSAGCQVLNNPKEFDQLLNLCKASGKKTFTYVLFEEGQVLETLGMNQPEAVKK